MKYDDENLVVGCENVARVIEDVSPDLVKDRIECMEVFDSGRPSRHAPHASRLPFILARRILKIKTLSRSTNHRRSRLDTRGAPVVPGGEVEIHLT